MGENVRAYTYIGRGHYQKPFEKGLQVGDFAEWLGVKSLAFHQRLNV